MINTNNDNLSKRTQSKKPDVNQNDNLKKLKIILIDEISMVSSNYIIQYWKMLSSEIFQNPHDNC